MTGLMLPVEVAERLAVRPATLAAWRCRKAGPPYVKADTPIENSPDLVREER